MVNYVPVVLKSGIVKDHNIFAAGAPIKSIVKIIAGDTQLIILLISVGYLKKLTLNL